jgi:transposase
MTSEQKNDLSEFIQDSSSVKGIKQAQAVLMLDSNTPYPTIENLTGLKKSRAFKLRSLFLKKGVKAFDNKPRRIFELLSKSQILELCNTVKSQKPSEVDKLFSSESFWTVSILCDFVWIKFGVRYKSKTSYYAIFRKTNFTFHKPAKVYVKQDIAEIEKWTHDITQILQKYWDDPNTTILCEDESIISSQTTTQKVWLESGQYPKIEVNSKKTNKSIYGFLNIKTGREHAFSTDYQTMYETTKILKKVRQIYPKEDNNRNKLKGTQLVILWDNAGWHRGSVVQEYIKKDGNITQIYFPKYSPQLNPQEHVWEDGKEKKVKNRYIQSVDQTSKELIKYLNTSIFRYKLLNFQS